MTKGYWFGMSYRKDGKKIETIGLDYGVDPIIVYQRGEFELWKIPGRTSTLPGAINPEYFPTEYRIVQVKEVEPRNVKYIGRNISWNGQTVTHEYTPISDAVRPGLKWRKAVDNMMAEIINLADGKGV